MNAIDTDVVAAIARQVAAEVGELRYNLWFKDNARLELTDHELVVGVPNLFFQEWLGANFLAALRRAVESATGRRLPVRMVVDAEMYRATQSREPSDAPATAATEPPPANGSHKHRLAARGQTLENFVVGGSNRMAHAAAVRVVESPVARFNPLVLYGPLGVGKTHLLRGIAHGTRERHPGLKVLYLTAETFTNSFLEDMRGGRLAAFRQRTRGADLLLIDDIQFMAAKRATQAELLHTYESLDAEGKQVVLAIDRHPRMIEGFSSDLVDRLAAGMTCPMEPPDYELRIAILEIKSQALGLRLSGDVLQFMAMQFRTNVRELEGAINRLQAHAELARGPLDLDAARAALAELLQHRPKLTSIEEVERAVCEAFGVRAEQLRSSDRSRSITQPRMLAMYLIRKHTGAAYDAIGRRFGRNHSTAMFAERKVEGWLDEAGVLQFAGRTWSALDAIRAVEQKLK